MNPTRISLTALIACYILMVIMGFIFYPKWNKSGSEATLSWDVSGYYMYLPGTFIYQDLRQCNFKDSLLSKYHPTPDFQQAFLHKPSGNYVMKYSMGQAIMMSPFFLAGHLWAVSASNYADDGFSFPYQVSIGIGMFLLSLLGLWVLRKILLRYFPDVVVALVLVAYVFGTNYLNFSSIDQAMTHSSLFTVYCLIIWYSIKFYERPDFNKAIAVGMLCGLATLTRPTEIISILLPLFWGINSIAALRQRWLFFREHAGLFLTASLSFLAVVLLQSLYWHWATGEWLIYSYEKQGFSFLNPHFHKFTLSYQTGWLVFCPMMIFSFLGIWPYLKKFSGYWSVIFFFFLSYYITASWDVWDYGGSSGRAMIQYYPVLAFPFAAFIQSVREIRWRQWLFYPFFLLFIYINIWWTIHAHWGNVPIFWMTKAYYWQVIGRWRVDDFQLKLLDNKYSFRGHPKEYLTLFTHDFESDTAAVEVKKNGDRILMMTGQNEFSPEYFIAYSGKERDWIRVFADFRSDRIENESWKQLQLIVKFYYDEKLLQSNFIKPQRFMVPHEMKNIFMDTRPPARSWNRMGIIFWNPGSTAPMEIDNLKVITFNSDAALTSEN